MSKRAQMRREAKAARKGSARYSCTAAQIRAISHDAADKAVRRADEEIRAYYDRMFKERMRAYQADCFNAVVAISLSVLYDKFGFRSNLSGTGRCQRYVQAVQDLLNDPDVNWKDLQEEVFQKTGIRFLVEEATE